ncbi:MAG: leucine-rich repeat protein, partial [Ruminococcus sp.]|nr:leucine-rich repeat protein [Ruminococcus sp.]
VLPDSIEVIDTLAFTDCQYLEKINFPEKLEYIGRLAFYACNSMTEVNIDCPELILRDNCFTESRGLVSANINAKEIGERAFSFCKSLNSITLGNDVKKIDCQAFWGDFSVPEITIPGSVKAIGQNAFGGIRSVKLSVYPKILGAYPHKTTEILLSGLQPPPPVRPLQDDPQCVFDEDCTVYGYAGTSDEKYADEWELNFVPLDYLKGDVNFDGEFNVADVVTINSFMHGSKDQEIVYWKAADVCEDDVIDIFDLLKLKEDLVKSNEKPVTN